MIAAGMLQGCSASGPSPDIFSKAPATEFRYVARNVASELYDPSCDAPRGFNRFALLRSEAAAMAELKKRLQDTPAMFHLQVALDDAEQIRRAEGSCWNDNDLAFAKIHVEMSQKSVRTGLPQLQKLAREINGDSSDVGVQASGNAEIRYLARHLMDYTQPQCTLTTKAPNNLVMKAARAEVAALKTRLRDTDHGLHFSVAEADASYERSITMVECATPSSEALGKLSAEALAETKKQAAEILRIIGA